MILLLLLSVNISWKNLINVRLAPMSLKKIPTNDHYLLYVSLITFLNLSQSKPPIKSLTFLSIQ